MAVVIFTGTSVYLNYILLHYWQFGSQQSLIKLETKCQHVNRKVIKTLQTLALINEHLNKLMSFPLLLSLLINILSLVSSICVSIVLPEIFTPYVYFSLLHNFFSYMYILYITNLNRKVLYKVQSILEQVQKHQQNLWLEGKMSKKVGLICSEIELFESRFSIQIFELLTVNWSTLSSVVLFSLGFIVFLFQTY